MRSENDNSGGIGATLPSTMIEGNDKKQETIVLSTHDTSKILYTRQIQNAIYMHIQNSAYRSISGQYKIHNIDMSKMF